MRFDGLDLNLLVALDALLTNRNVSRTAEQLALSQSALSGGLARLREYFKDDLLRNVGGRYMVLTPRAESLVEPVRAVLMQVRSTITMDVEFDPATSQRHFKVAASHYAVRTRLAPAFNAIYAVAPHLGLTIQNISPEEMELLDRGELDLLITLDTFVTRDHPHTLISDDEMVVLAWRDNPHVGDDISEDLFFELGHVTVRFENMREPAHEDWLRQSSPRHRRAEITLPSFSDVPYFLVGTHRIATVQKKLAEAYATVYPLKILAMPLSLPRVRLAVQWNRLNGEEPGIRWLRDQLCKSMA